MQDHNNLENTSNKVKKKLAKNNLATQSPLISIKPLQPFDYDANTDSHKKCITVNMSVSHS